MYFKGGCFVSPNFPCVCCRQLHWHACSWASPTTMVPGTWLLFVERRTCWVLPCCGVFSFYAWKPLIKPEIHRCFSSFLLGHKALIILSQHLLFCWCSGAGRLSSSVPVLRRNQQRNALLEWLQNQQNAATSLFIPSE